MKRFFKEYSVELVSAGVILIGIFLVADFSIRETILAALGNMITAVVGMVKRILAETDSRAAGLPTSDLLGVLLILLAMSFIVWRIRYRFQTGQRWAIDYCPKCSGPIMRVHRSLWDRLLGATFLPEARRYRCVDLKCGWSGLLRRHIHHHHHRSEQVANPEKSQTEKS